MKLDLSQNKLKKFIDKRLVILFLYLFWVFNELRTHAMWRDELQAWLIASDSRSLQELFLNTRYEGRAPLWHMILWPLSNLTTNPETMKFLVFFGTLFCAIMILYFIKIPIFIKLAILVSFIFFGGYTTLARDYILLLILFILFVYVKKSSLSYSKPLLIAAVFSLVNLFGLIIGISIFLAEVVRLLLNKDLLKVDLKMFVSLIIFLLSSFISVLSINPTEDNSAKPNPRIDLLANFDALRWRLNSTFYPLDNLFLDNWLFLIVSLVISASLVALFKISKYSFTFVLVGFFLSSINYVYGYAHYWWHFGVLFLIFLSGLLISVDFTEKNKRVFIINAFLVALLTPNILANFYGPGVEVFSSRPYSNAKNVAEYLRVKCMPDCEVIVNLDYAGTSVSAYLDGLPIFFANSQSYGTFVVWNQERSLNFGWDPVMTAVNNSVDPYILIVGLEEPPKSLELVAEFKGAVWSDEDFSIYKIKRNEL